MHFYVHRGRQGYALAEMYNRTRPLDSWLDIIRFPARVVRFRYQCSELYSELPRINQVLHSQCLIINLLQQPNFFHF